MSTEEIVQFIEQSGDNRCISRTVFRTSLKDLFNLRVAPDVVAGLATLALATAISVLSIAFGEFGARTAIRSYRTN